MELKRPLTDEDMELAIEALQIIVDTGDDIYECPTCKRLPHQEHQPDCRYRLLLVMAAEHPSYRPFDRPTRLSWEIEKPKQYWARGPGWRSEVNAVFGSAQWTWVVELDKPGLRAGGQEQDRAKAMEKAAATLAKLLDAFPVPGNVVE